MIEHAVLRDAHKFSTRQRSRYRSGETVGCFSCESVFPADSIEEWCDETDADQCTAICPECGIDAVVSLAEVLSLGITAAEFAPLLHEMKSHWFEE